MGKPRAGRVRCVSARLFEALPNTIASLDRPALKTSDDLLWS